MRKEEWICHCGEKNYSYRALCRKCKHERNSYKDHIKYSDWICVCGVINRFGRSVCYKCHNIKNRYIPTYNPIYKINEDEIRKFFTRISNRSFKMFYENFELECCFYENLFVVWKCFHKNMYQLNINTNEEAYIAKELDRKPVDKVIEIIRTYNVFKRIECNFNDITYQSILRELKENNIIDYIFVPEDKRSSPNILKLLKIKGEDVENKFDLHEEVLYGNNSYNTIIKLYNEYKGLDSENLLNSYTICDIKYLND